MGKKQNLPVRRAQTAGFAGNGAVIY